MQEGIFSLMQLAKTSALLAALHEEGEPFISVLTHPTTAGVMASYASLGDVIIAEPRALLGFAGPRVIQQTIGQALPEGFQSSEFFRDHDGLFSMKYYANRLGNNELQPLQTKPGIVLIQLSSEKFSVTAIC